MATQNDDKLAKAGAATGALAVMNPELRVDFTALEEELGGQISLRALLTKVKMPSGGARTWEIEDADSEAPEAAPTIEGVIVAHRPTNAYWSTESDTGENSPPDCASGDGVTAFGIRVALGETEATAHVCGVAGQQGCCPLNEYGSDPGGGKSCKNMHEVYLLRPSEVLPLLIVLPPTSIRPFLNYLGKHIIKGRRPATMLTRVGLEKVGEGNTAYSRAVFSFGGLVEDEAALPFLAGYGAQIKELTEKVAPIIAATATDASVMPDASEAF